MHGIQCGEVEFQNYSSLVDSWYIPVHTGTCWYVLLQTETKQHTSLDHALSALLRLQVLAERLAWSFRTVSLRTAVSFTVRPPRRGLPRPKFHSICQHIPVHTGIYWYVLVCTGIYWYMPVHTGMK